MTAARFFTRRWCAARVVGRRGTRTSARCESGESTESLLVDGFREGPPSGPPASRRAPSRHGRCPEGHPRDIATGRARPEGHLRDVHRREGHLRDMAGVPKGTLATSPPDGHVARATFGTLTVAR